MKKISLLLVFVLLFLTFAASCGEVTPPAEEKETYKVMLSVPDGVTVKGNNPVTVNEGEDAVFELSVPSDMAFLKTDGGTYDTATDTLTVSGVRKNMTVTVQYEKTDYDAKAKVRYIFGGSTGDTSSVAEGFVRFGTEVTVTAGNTSKFFAGWVYDTDKTKIISRDKTFSFRITPDIAELLPNGVYRVGISPKYVSLDTLYYNANGGEIHTDTVNAAGNTYMSVDTSGINLGTLKVTLRADYVEKVTAATAFWNDGTFTRDGYILKEFNTKADGSGEPYSPGSKVYPLNDDGTAFTLYCIWEKYEASDFTYETVTMPYPVSKSDKNGGPIDPSKATHWHTEGVRITGYTGNAATVAVPDMLDGKPVIAIGAGVFKDKAVETLVLPRTIQRIEDGAMQGLSSLTTMYYPNGVYELTNDIVDAVTKNSLKTLVVYASMAPRYTKIEGGDFSVKLARVLATKDENRVIVIAGSSTFQGLSSDYLMALLDGDYTVVNFGTTRTTHGALYLEAIGHYTHDGDIVIFSPENSTYMMGDTTLYWKTLRDLEGMNNIFRYVDISKYDNVFGAFRDFNQGISYDNQAVSMYYDMNPVAYEYVCEKITSDPAANGLMTRYGDDVKKEKNNYCLSNKYKDVYTVTLNAFFRNQNEGAWQDSKNQTDYTDTKYWSDITGAPYRAQMTHAVAAAKAGGAKVYFGFCPVDADAVISEAHAEAWLSAFDGMMKDSYGFDDTVGSVKNYIFAHEYFYDCAFHTNNYGRVWRTYRLYTDLCALIGREAKYGVGDVGTSFIGCSFEKDGTAVRNTPKFEVSYLD